MTGSRKKSGRSCEEGRGPGNVYYKDEGSSEIGDEKSIDRISQSPIYSRGL